MRKYRVKELVTRQGRVLYIAQVRRCLLWHSIGYQTELRGVAEESIRQRKLIEDLDSAKVRKVHNA